MYHAPRSKRGLGGSHLASSIPKQSLTNSRSLPLASSAIASPKAVPLVMPEPL